MSRRRPPPPSGQGADRRRMKSRRVSVHSPPPLTLN